MSHPSPPVKIIIPLGGARELLPKLPELYVVFMKFKVFGRKTPRIDDDREKGSAKGGEERGDGRGFGR